MSLRDLAATALLVSPTRRVALSQLTFCGLSGGHDSHGDAPVALEAYKCRGSDLKTVHDSDNSPKWSPVRNTEQLFGCPVKKALILLHRGPKT